MIRPSGRLRLLAFTWAITLLLSPLVAREARAALGEDTIVLPGFAPIARNGYQLRLGDRLYDWSGGTYLPVVYSRGSVIAGPMSLRIQVAGQRWLLTPSSVQVVTSTPHHAVVQATGTATPGLAVAVTTRVEYDGVAMVTVTLTPSAPIDIDALDFEADIRSNPATRMLKFQTADIRLQKRDHAIQPSYAGPFLNAITVADGERSYWWFADNAEGWIWNGATVTELAPLSSDRLRLRQRLIGSRYRLASARTMKMNFLVTPVRELGSSWRRERLAGGISSAEASIARILGWWSTALAHTALPFTEPAPSIVSQIPAADWVNYPGLATNRYYLQRNLAKGFQSLPYFSAHCLSELDPTLDANRTAWEVDPPFVVLSADSSYPTRFEKPVLSQRASGYRDYTLSRLSQEIDKLGMNGIYLDHASIMDSKSPYHGAWTDSNGRVQPSTDILGMRDFLKRLRVLFYLKGKPGLVLIHASNSEIVPAYTFATGIVDGEHFAHRLVADDYIASVPLDQVRMQNAPGQYGVRNMWIPQFDRFHGGDPTWPTSAAGVRAFRNLMTLILLHDGELWPSFVSQQERYGIYGALDAFGVNQATFHGYWQTAPLATTARPLARVSAYKRTGKLLLVVGNLSTSAEAVDVRVSLAGAGLPAGAGARLLPQGTPLAFSDGRLDLSVPAKDFRLIEIR